MRMLLVAAVALVAASPIAEAQNGAVYGGPGWTTYGDALIPPGMLPVGPPQSWDLTPPPPAYVPPQTGALLPGFVVVVPGVNRVPQMHFPPQVPLNWRPSGVPGQIMGQ